MRRFLSVMLSVLLLMSVVVLPAAAEDENPCLLFQGAGKGAREGSSVFTTAYWYIQESYTSRKPNQSTGIFDYTLVFDLYIDDYTTAGSSHSGLVMSQDVGGYCVGYDFDAMAFVVDQRFMMFMNDPENTVRVASAGYELSKDTWYEIAHRFMGSVVSMYVNGIEILSYDLAKIGYYQTAVTTASDYLFFCPYECDVRLDNFAVYSGDYDFGTGTATSTFMTADTPEIVGNSIRMGDFGTQDDCSNSLNTTWFAYGTNGTDKVTYDRDYAGSHVHDPQVIEHVDATCLADGYDYVSCDCGMSYKTNIVAALGHLPGIVNSTTAATETSSGVENRICNRCYEQYNVVIPATGDNAKCLYLDAAATRSILNGYTAVGEAGLIDYLDGIAVSLDIMPVGHHDKPYASIGANIGSLHHAYWAGYSYNLGGFIIAPNNEPALEDCYAFVEADLPDYVWGQWVFVRDGLTMSLYIDGELIISCEGDPELLTGDQNNDGYESLGENYVFLFNSYATDIYMDNFIVADPDYDLETNTGVIYDFNDFNDGSFVTAANICNNYSKEQGAGLGFVIVNCGRPMETQVDIHKDMAISFTDVFGDSTVEGKGYSSLNDTNINGVNAAAAFIAAKDAGNLDFEFTYNFNASEWCTDETVLNGATSFIGGYVNTEATTSASAGGAAGYDFNRQQVVIGALGGMYHTNFATNDDGSIIGAAVDYAVEAGKWYEMTISYKMDPETFIYTVSVAMNGEVIATYTYDYLNVSFFIFYPSNVNCLLDNMSMKLGGAEFFNSDFTKGWDLQTVGLNFTGPGYSMVEGGIGTHVYTETKYPASCLTDGYTVYVCSCGESEYTLYNLEAPGHSWDDGVVTLEPTTESTGIKTFTCGVCGDTYEEEIPMLEPEYTLGDVTGDGSINAADVTPLKRVIASLTTNYVEKAADITGDGSINAMDLQVLVRYCAGLSTVLS